MNIFYAQCVFHTVRSALCFAVHFDTLLNHPFKSSPAIMANISRSDLLHRQADLAHDDSRLLRDIADDVHAAARILRYKAYDFRDQGYHLRHSAWKVCSKNREEGIVDYPTDEDRRRNGDMACSASKMVDAAQNVKVALNALIEIAQGHPNFPEENSKGSVNKKGTKTDRNLDSCPPKSGDLTTTSHLPPKDPDERVKLHRQDNGAPPVNFQLIIPRREVQVTDPAAAAPPHVKEPHGEQTRAERGRPRQPWATAGRSSRVVDGRRATAKKDLARSRSPARESEGTEEPDGTDEEDLLA